jgi:hypothetical protein
MRIVIMNFSILIYMHCYLSLPTPPPTPAHGLKLLRLGTFGEVYFYSLPLRVFVLELV